MKARLLKVIVWPWWGMALAAAPATAHAYCIGWDKSLPHYDPNFYSVSHEFRRSKYVIEARVVRETWLGEDGKEKSLQPPSQNGGPKPWGFDPYVGAYYDVEVLTPFKGGPPRRLRLFSENSTARFWFDVGSKHLLFISGETFDPPIGNALTVDTCGNSKPFATASGLLRSLRKLATSSGR